MTFSNKISIIALLCLISNTAWSHQVNFCKVKKIYDSDIKVPVEIVYEDCSGVAFYWYAKDFVKASCWEGATNLIEGKCEAHKGDDQGIIPEDTGSEVKESEIQD